jgi:hypothetical protein
MSVKFLKTSSKNATKLKLKSKHGETLNLSQDLVVFFFEKWECCHVIFVFLFLLFAFWQKNFTQKNIEPHTLECLKLSHQTYFELFYRNYATNFKNV